MHDPVSIAGPISIYGGDVTLREDLSSSLSGADILVKGRGDLETIASRSVLTNNGDIVLWSNSDNSGGGSIVLGDNNVLNSSNGRSGDTDSGGARLPLPEAADMGRVRRDTVHRQPEQESSWERARPIIRRYTRVGET